MEALRSLDGVIDVRTNIAQAFAYIYVKEGTRFDLNDFEFVTDDYGYVVSTIEVSPESWAELKQS